MQELLGAAYDPSCWLWCPKIGWIISPANIEVERVGGTPNSSACIGISTLRFTFYFGTLFAPTQEPKSCTSLQYKTHATKHPGLPMFQTSESRIRRPASVLLDVCASKICTTRRLVRYQRHDACLLSCGPTQPPGY